MTILETPWPDRVLVIRGFNRTMTSHAAFSEDEVAAAETFHLPKRREQWLASRLAAKQLAVRRGVCASLADCTFERPFILNRGAHSGWYASLSHSAGYAAATLSRQPAGIDIEVIRPVAWRAAQFFLRDVEIEMMQACRIDDVLLHFWCAKEAAWKQRSSEFTTLKQVPLRLLEVRDEGLVFDAAESARLGELIVAVTRQNQTD